MKAFFLILAEGFNGLGLFADLLTFSFDYYSFDYFEPTGFFMRQDLRIGWGRDLRIGLGRDLRIGWGQDLRDLL